jgi:hypothetical protein
MKQSSFTLFSIVLFLTLILFPSLSYCLISGSLILFNVNLPFENIVFLVSNIWWINLVPKVLGSIGLCVLLIKNRHSVNLQVLKNRLFRLSVIGFTACLCVSVIVAEAPLANAMTVATTGYVLDTPLPIADWYIGQYSNGNYFAINGSNWDNLVAGVGSTSWAEFTGNYTKLTELVFDSIINGTVYLKDVPFNLALINDIPEDVQVICNLNSVTYTYVSLASGLGSYTVSVGVNNNNGYYIVQDSNMRVCYASVNASNAIQLAINVTTSGNIYVKNGFYPLHPLTQQTNMKGATEDFTGNIALVVKSNIALIGEKGACLEFQDNIVGPIVFFLPAGTCNSTISGLTVNMASTVFQQNSYFVLANGNSTHNIVNNVIKDNSFGTVRNGILLVNYCYYNTISNNYFNNSGYAMHTYSSVSTGKCGYNTWSNNYVYKCIEGVNIEHTGACADSILDNTIVETTGNGIVVQVSAALVKGNNIVWAGTGATTSLVNSTAGIYLRYYPHNTIVTGNYIGYSFCQAICVWSGGHDISITDNFISHANLEAYNKSDGSAYSAIEIYDSETYPFYNGFIANNHIVTLYQYQQVRASGLHGYNNTLCNNVLPKGLSSGKSVTLDSTWSVYGNTLYNPVGYISKPINSVTYHIVDSGSNSTFISDVTYTNVQSPKTLYISGGTVTNITKNGQSIGLTSGTIYLAALDTFSITFSSTPTIIVYGE